MCEVFIANSRFIFLEVVVAQQGECSSSTTTPTSSFRRADAAQVCFHLLLAAVVGDFEWSVFMAARHTVSERW